MLFFKDGWPTFLWGGINKQREIEHTVIVTERLGPSMQLLLEQNSEEEGEGDGKNPRGFSLKTVLMLAPQMIDLVQLVHSKKIVHGDIRPNHFMFGVADEKVSNQSMAIFLLKKVLV